MVGEHLICTEDHYLYSASSTFSKACMIDARASLRQVFQLHGSSSRYPGLGFAGNKMAGVETHVVQAEHNAPFWY